MPWVGPFFVEPGSEVRVPVRPISAMSHPAAEPEPNDCEEVDSDTLLAAPEPEADDDDDSIGADSDKVPKPLLAGRGRGGQRRGRGRAGRGSSGSLPLKRPAASSRMKRPAGVMRRPSADGIAMKRPSAALDGSDEIPAVDPARTKPVGDKTYGCAKCRHNKTGCPGRCRKLAQTGSSGYYFDDDGFVKHAG